MGFEPRRRFRDVQSLKVVAMVFRREVGRDGLKNVLWYQLR